MRDELLVQGDRGALLVKIDPARGAEIASVAWRGQEILDGWELLHGGAPDATDFEPGQRTWLSSYRGGWQELLPNSGATAYIDGIHHPFHGAASLAQWIPQRLSTGRIELGLTLDSPELELTKVISVDAATPRIVVETHVLNRGHRSVQILWGHHPAFRLDCRTTIDIRCVGRSTLWNFGACLPAELCEDPLSSLEAVPAEGSALVILTQVPGWVGLRRADGVGIALSWDRTMFPNVWLWLDVATPAWPFLGRARLIAVEPQRSSTLDGVSVAVTQGEAITLVPGQSLRAAVCLSLFDADGRAVVGVTEEGGPIVGK